MCSNVLSDTRMDKTQRQREKQWIRRMKRMFFVALGYYASSAGGFGTGVGAGVGGWSGNCGGVMATVHDLRGQVMVGVSEGVRACPIRTWSQFSERSSCCGEHRYRGPHVLVRRRLIRTDECVLCIFAVGCVMRI